MRRSSMADNRPDVLLVGPSKPLLAKGLELAFTVHRLIEAKDRESFLSGIADRIRAFAVTYSNQKIDAAFMQRFPRLEIVSSFGVGYRHYPGLIDMGRDADVLMVIVPGGAETRNLIGADVLEALGPKGILINVARGSVVDEPALIAALREKKIFAAGLDVFVSEPRVPAELMEMENVVLFPHLGSASTYTRAAMDQLVVDNLVSWASGKGPLTPVPETPSKK